MPQDPDAAAERVPLAHLELLAQAGRELAEVGLKVRARFDVAAREATKLLGNGCIAWQWSRDGHWLEPLSIHHRDAEHRSFIEHALAGARIPSTAGCHASALQTNAPVVTTVRSVEDARALPLPQYEAYFQRFGAYRIISAPMRVHGRPVGVLAVNRLLDTDDVTIVDSLSLWSLASHAAVSIENARLHESVVAARRDLEERVTARTRELELALGELEAFNSAVAHDLRNPLQLVMLHAHLLHEALAEREDDEGVVRVQKITRAADRMNAIIGALLRLARVDRVPITRERVDVTAIASGIVDELRHAEPHRSVSVHVESGLEARADPHLIRLVLENLVSNAWKFTASVQDARIRVRRDPDSEAPAFVVEDTGVGLPADAMDRLFKPFERLHATSAYPGTGLGLVTVKRIVARHGGDVWAEGAPGRGAAFGFTLPPE